MTAILIDYEKIITPKLQEKLSKPPKIATTTQMVGLILIVDSSAIKSLQKIPKGKERVKYLENIKIHNHYYVQYNKQKELCILPWQCYKDIKIILSALFAGFPESVTLWVAIDPESLDILNKFASNGFNNPYITRTTPLRTSIPTSISLIRKNIPTEEYNANKTMNKILYSLEQYKNSKGSCSIHVQLSPRAVSFLRKTSKIGITVNGNGKKSQKELTGELTVKNVVKQDNKFVYIIDVDEGSVQSGAEEDVDVSPTRYNFHSHPHEAYVRHSVDKAWPSLTDYLGYLKLGTNTIFHCVATLEGIYIMSFSPYWGSRLDQVSKSFVSSHYNIDHKEHYTPEAYAEKVNSIMYKKHPIYNIQFFPWNKAKNVFSISYSKIGINCFATEKGIRQYEKLHK